jgi:hypothetical protein
MPKKSYDFAVINAAREVGALCSFPGPIMTPAVGASNTFCPRLLEAQTKVTSGLFYPDIIISAKPPSVLRWGVCLDQSTFAHNRTAVNSCVIDGASSSFNRLRACHLPFWRRWRNSSALTVHLPTDSAFHVMNLSTPRASGIAGMIFRLTSDYPGGQN